jgi:hypothetical protein
MTIHHINGIKVRTSYSNPPIPWRNFDWAAVDDDTYDIGCSEIGYGPNEEMAIADLMEQLEERAA